MLRLRNRIKIRRVIYVMVICFSILVSTEGSDVYANTTVLNYKASEIRSHSMIDYYNAISKNHNGSYVFYYLAGGVNNIFNPEYINAEVESVVHLRQPHRFGYRFLGWYKDKNYKNKIYDAEAIPGQATTAYAKWGRKIDNYYSVEHYNYSADDDKESSTRTLKSCDYEFCEDINIPGMPETKDSDLFNKYIYSVSQCPQGLCFTDDFVLVTSYSNEDGCLGELLVFDIDTGEFMFTLGMDDKSHLGGIAFDGENVWVCNSRKSCIERLSYDFIKLMAYENTKDVVDATEVVDIYKVENTPSCITYYSGRLWIASHSQLWNSQVKAYHYDDKENTLSPLNNYTIPAKVQGIAFGEGGEVYLSSSLGRGKSSYLKKYESLIKMSSNPNKPEVTIEMPPCSEEIDMIDGSLYVLFESAGEKYLEGTDGKGESISPIDKILKINTESI